MVSPTGNQITNYSYYDSNQSDEENQPIENEDPGKVECSFEKIGNKLNEIADRHMESCRKEGIPDDYRNIVEQQQAFTKMVEDECSII